MKRLLVGLLFCVGLVCVAGTGCTSDPGANDPKIQDKAPPTLQKMIPGGAGGDGKKTQGLAKPKPE